MREEVIYRIAMDDGQLVMKQVISESKGIFTQYVWNYKKKDWVESREVCAGYFIGYDNSFLVTEEEALEKIKKNTEEMAGEN